MAGGRSSRDTIVSAHPIVWFVVRWLGSVAKQNWDMWDLLVIRHAV